MGPGSGPAVISSAYDHTAAGALVPIRACGWGYQPQIRSHGTQQRSLRHWACFKAFTAPIIRSHVCWHLPASADGAALFPLHLCPVRCFGACECLITYMKHAFRSGACKCLAQDCTAWAFRIQVLQKVSWSRCANMVRSCRRILLNTCSPQPVRPLPRSARTTCCFKRPRSQQSSWWVLLYNCCLALTFLNTFNMSTFRFPGIAQ